MFVTAFALAAPTTWAPTPVHASVDSCTGTGVMTLGAGFGLLSSPSTSTTFSINMNVVCLTLSTQVSMSGFVNGWCGIMSGYGVAHVGATHPPPTGHRFAISPGASEFFTGEVLGDGSTLEDPLDSGSCTNKSAVNFLITGSFLLNHNGCAVTESEGPGFTVYQCALLAGEEAAA